MLTASSSPLQSKGSARRIFSYLAGNLIGSTSGQLFVLNDLQPDQPQKHRSKTKKDQQADNGKTFFTVLPAKTSSSALPPPLSG